jgi:PhzF family phenazine biosynthesis protein
MKITAYTINSFAKTAEGGNPAGVVLDADKLSEKEMRRIAGIIGFSETAFVMQSDCADFRVRFFTPNKEVDLCGHATIATFCVLAAIGCIKPGRYYQETGAGILAVEIKDDGTIMMNQNKPVFYEEVSREEMSHSLNISCLDLPEELPVQIVSTGLRDIMIPVKGIDVLNSIRPDFDEIASISKKYGVVGYHVFSLKTLNGSAAHCRNFAPLYAIPEESATGASNGALACYLYKYGKISSNDAVNIAFEQGYSMRKPSEILASLIIGKGEIQEVKVGGRALNMSQIEVEI